MDPVLVEAGSASIRSWLERWLLDTLRLIVGAQVLWTFRSQLQAIGEFALAAVVLADWQTAASTWGGIVVGRLIDCYREPRIVQSLTAIPASVIVHAWIGEALNATGVQSPVPVGLVLEALRVRSKLPATAYPFSRIEALYLHHRLTRATGLDAGVATDLTEVVFSWSTQWKPHTYREIYELVHFVFFLTDFGCNGWDAGYDALVPHRMAVTSSLDRAAEVCLQNGHWDLVGEVALARLCLDAASDVCSLLDTLYLAQRADGAIPGWRGACGIRGFYHSTLVTLLAFSKAMASSCCVHRDVMPLCRQLTDEGESSE